MYRAACAGPRPLALWLLALRELLQASGQWQPLAADAAGARVLLELRLDDAADARSVLDEGPGPVFSLQSFTRWVDEVLEAARFKPEGAPGVPAEVVVLPLSQLLGRPFAALVLDAETKKLGGMGLAHELLTELDVRPPVVLLTARPQDDWLAAWARADVVVPRPLDPMAVAAAVARAVRSRGTGAVALA